MRPEQLAAAAGGLTNQYHRPAQSLPLVHLLPWTAVNLVLKAKKELHEMISSIWNEILVEALRLKPGARDRLGILVEALRLKPGALEKLGALVETVRLKPGRPGSLLALPVEHADLIENNESAEPIAIRVTTLRRLRTGPSSTLAG